MTPRSSRANSIFEKPKMKWKQRRGGSITEEIDPATLSGYEYDTNKAMSGKYLTNFLQQSQWTDQLDQITIVWDHVPAFEELESYGDLDESDGTRACRRLFKAVVVWDELGNSLWKALRDLADNKHEALYTTRPMISVEDDDDGSADGRYFQDVGFTTTIFNSSRTSQESSGARRSLSTSDSNWDQCPCSYCKSGSGLFRSKTDSAKTSHRKRSGSVSSHMARTIGSNCANVVRKALGVFSERREACAASQPAVRA